MRGSDRSSSKRGSTLGKTSMPELISIHRSAYTALLMTHDIDLESEPAAKIAGRSAGTPFALLDVTRDVRPEIGRDHPLRLRGRGRPSDDGHGEKHAASKSDDWLSTAVFFM